MFTLFLLGLLFQVFVSAALGSAELGIQFENGDQDVPILKLEYATYRATYNETYDVSNTFSTFYAGN